ncbi:hypothetical protein PUNSTDRAFT_113763 [Punctularia strigosozonata HHB-11173 SS5]|uniref:uncharacterized protein n=1 Tax=Punctularia strigosozonata (strain HHB-11173) TaxID=741275 RepID=UPI00044167DF|nr:uncharacterized protein PUNSTDRAFT_113763 [Punctularia strigosozonata HHB-11173 SS5]EIN08167.1 hypothetical protein PUNSTDRAFT_113763 [Punctularia strigosozonata HHB-11173 SS5]
MIANGNRSPNSRIRPSPRPVESDAKLVAAKTVANSELNAHTSKATAWSSPSSAHSSGSITLSSEGRDHAARRSRAMCRLISGNRAELVGQVVRR